MDKAILKIIRDELPEQTAKQMRTFIDEAEVTKSDMKSARLTIEKMQIDLDRHKEFADEYSKALNVLKEAKDGHQANLDRSLELDRQERSLKCSLMETKLAMLREHTASMEKLVDKVFGHPSTTWITEKQIPVKNPEYNAQGMMSGGSSLQPVTESAKETEAKI